MKPLFTIHAGEYLVGSHIESHFKDWNVWVPSKDTGIDLLVTNAKNTKAVSLQVKYSKDFLTHDYSMSDKIVATGWWNFPKKKIAESKADLWVFVLPSFHEKSICFVIIPPAELLRRFQTIFGKSGNRVDSYIRVTKSQRCWETRGLKSIQYDLIALDHFEDSQRDFTQFFDANGWNQLKKMLKP